MGARTPLYNHQHYRCKLLYFFFKGGWTQVLFVKSYTSDLGIFNAQPLTMVSSSTLIGFSPMGNYAFQTDALAALQQVTSSTQFRFRC